MEIVQQQSVLVCLAFLAAIGAFAFACIMRKVAVVMVVLGLLVASHVAMSACGGCTTTPTAARMGAEPTYHVLLTYHALDYILCGNIRAVDHVFARGEERMHGDAPPKEKLAKFKDVDYYVTIGAPVETKIEKTLRELNPKIKVFAATNGCHLIEHNHYLWYSVRNIDIMRTNCRDVFAPTLFRCGTMLDPNLFKKEKMTVGVTHDAFEYWCRFNGIRYSRIPEEFDEAELKARDIRIVYKARRGIGVCVRQSAATGIVIVEADPFVSCDDLYIDLLDPYRVVLKKFRDEEAEREWEKLEKDEISVSDR